MKTTLRFILLPLLVVVLGVWMFADRKRSPASQSGVVVATVAPDESWSSPQMEQSRVDEVVGSRVGDFNLIPVLSDVGSDAEDEDSNEALARSVAGMEGDELIRRLSALPLEDLRGNLGRLLVRRWAELDSSAASRWVTQLDDVEASHELSTAVALAWSERDMKGSLEWARALPAGDLQSRVLTELGVELARIDPMASMRLAVELPASGSRDGILLHALHQWAGQDAETSQNWTLQLSLGPLREQALAAVATVMANQNGESAARFAVGQLLPGPEQDRAVIGIIQRWAQLDYDPAAAWVASFPQTPLRENAIAVLAGFAPPHTP